MQEDVQKLISQTVDSLKDEIVAFLQELVRIETENPPGNNYIQFAEAFGNKMKEFGLAVTYVRTPDDRLSELSPQGDNLPRVSVIGTLVGKQKRPLIHLSGHYDVVPAGTGWSVDPYSGEIRENKIYGRGSSDQKSGLVAQIFAIKALQEAGFEPEGTIVSSTTPDEETGGYAGMGYLVESGYLNRENTDYCVITECLGVDTVCLGHRGTIWFEIETKGKQSHGSMPTEGINAIDKMVKLINRLKEEIEPVINVKSKHPIVPEKCRSGSLTATMINAGTNINTVPNSCRAFFDLRLIPEQDVAEIQQMVISCCEKLKKEDSDFDYSFKLIQAVKPTLVPSDTAVVNAFLEAGEAYLGKVPYFAISPGSDDQKFVVDQGQLEQCIVYGPGPLRVAHQSDECIPIEDLINGTKIMALAIAKLVGASKKK